MNIFLFCYLFVCLFVLGGRGGLSRQVLKQLILVFVILFFIISKCTTKAQIVLLFKTLYDSIIL